MNAPRHIDQLPVVRLLANEIPQEFHCDVWRESCAMMFDAEPLEKQWVFPGDSTVYMADELMFTHVCFPATRFTRRPLHKAHGDGDGFLLQFNRSGRQKGLLDDDTELALGPDRITLQDLAHGYTAVSQPTDTFGILIPRHLIQASDRLYRKQPVLSWGIHSVQGKLLLSALQSVWHDLPYARTRDAESLALGFVGLLNGVISADSNIHSESCVESAVFTAMKEYLQQNLSDKELTADKLGRIFQCSRATVYRLFQEYGGVHSYIRDLRLIRCFRELLCNTATKRGSVRAIAESWGFYDVAHFSNLFKKRYGVRPSDMLGCPDIDIAKQITTDADYLRQITTLRTWSSRY